MTKTKTCEICKDEDDVTTFHVEIVDHDEREQYMSTMDLCGHHGAETGFWLRGVDVAVLDPV